MLQLEPINPTMTNFLRSMKWNRVTGLTQFSSSSVVMIFQALFHPYALRFTDAPVRVNTTNLPASFCQNAPKTLSFTNILFPNISHFIGLSEKKMWESSQNPHWVTETKYGCTEEEIKYSRLDKTLYCGPVIWMLFLSGNKSSDCAELEANGYMPYGNNYQFAIRRTTCSLLVTE